MGRRYWWPGALPEQVTLLQNFAAKIVGYKDQLEWTDTQAEKAFDLSNSIISAINVASQCRATMQAVTNWREIVMYGEPKGSPVGMAPLFPVIDGAAFVCGMVDQFFDLRDQIVANAGYTLAMGEDLGIVGPEIPGKIPSETAPDLRTVSTSSNVITITGSMQGLPVMRVEYAEKGQTYSSVAIVTNLPATIEVPMVDDTPQVGTIRSIFVKNNADFGNYSPNYDVTLT